MRLCVVSSDWNLHERSLIVSQRITMGKSARKNKEKKKDFQKVKLKVGKKLPKADNFTDTTFKSRAIQIREQLKAEKGDEPVTQRKQNIQELLCQVNHYNSSVRSNAIHGIKTLLTTNPALIPEHLPTLIPSLSCVMSDKETAVRQAGMSVLRVIMDALASYQMAPFFPTVCMHLCCAMTHIQEDVQLDSLVVMETILQYYPDLIASHCKELLTNFIHLISQQKDNRSSSLKVNPSGKLAGQKWRLKVLQMLEKFLDVIRKSKEKDLIPEREDVMKTIKVNSTGDKPIYASILKANGALGGRLRPFVLRTDQAVSNLGIDFLSDPEAIMDVVHTLVPLLLQCWGEVNLPGKGKGEGGVSIGQKEAEMLGCVVTILQTLWIILEQASQEKGSGSSLAELRKTYRRKIGQQFQRGFPYALHQHAQSTTKRGNSKPPSGSSHGVTPINLSACNLVLSILDVEGDKSRPWLEMAREFIEDVLRGDGQLGQGDQEVLMEVVLKLMNRSCDFETSRSLEDALFVYYKNAHPLSQQKLRALRTLRAVCLDRSRADTKDISPNLPSFFDSLGEVIIEARSSSTGTSQEALHTLLVAASRGHSQAVRCMEKHLTQWLDPDSAITDCLDQETQRSLLTCLYYLPSLNLSVMNQLTRYCCKTNSDVRFPIYLIANRCFDNVMDMSRKPPLTHSCLLKFVFTVSMGITCEDLSSLEQKMKLSSSEQATLQSLHPCYHITHGSREVQLLHRANDVIQVAMQVYRRHSDQEVVMTEVLAHVQDILKSFHVLPVCSVLSILRHTSMLQRCHSTPSASQSLSSASSSSPSSSLPSSQLRAMSASKETLHHVERLAGNLAFVLLYETAVRNMADVVREEEEYVMELWKRTIDSVAVLGDETIGSLLESALCACKDHPDDRQIGNVIVRLLQSRNVKKRLHNHCDKLLTLVKLIEDHLAAPSDSRWFSELKYEVSLLAKELNI